MTKKRYTLDEVKNDLRSFFTDESHRLFKYGTPTPDCNKDCPFHKRDLQVMFEEDYPHDITMKAVQALITEGFLSQKVLALGSSEIHFIHRYNLRYVTRLMKDTAELIRQYSDYRISKATGDYAEMLFGFMFRLNGFAVVARHVNQYDGTRWLKEEGPDLDFIIEKDRITYGVEIKNTFDYMPPDEFQEKIDLCKRHGIIPLFPLRCPSDRQFETMQSVNGLALKFKSRIFPPGQEQLVRDIWSYMRLPVTVWHEIPLTVEKQFKAFHDRQIALQKKDRREGTSHANYLPHFLNTDLLTME